VRSQVLELGAGGRALALVALFVAAFAYLTSLL